MNAITTLAALVLATTTLAGSAAAQDARDPRTAADVAHAVQGSVHFTVFDDVRVEAAGGDVILRGKVTTPLKRSEIERRVARVEGVRRVRNDIGVLPVSASDDDLRRRVARAIYGNPSFWSYAARANPPIHIIVEHGRVTLTGVVSSNVERVLARSLATGLGELAVVNELRTDAEVRTMDSEAY